MRKPWLNNLYGVLSKMSSSAISVFQIISGMLCAAAAFGVLLSMIFVRGNYSRSFIDVSGSTENARRDVAQFDVAYTDKTYLLTSIIASLGALASFKQNTGVFVVFLVVAVSFQIAEHWLLPRMRMAAELGEPLPLTQTRARFELLQAFCLLLVFGNLAMPPLVTLVRIHGL